MALRPVEKGWDPSLWASRVPLGLGQQKPNNYLEILGAAVESRDRLPYAWRILRDGVCDGCALGTSGMRDWTIDGVHLCNVRLRLLRLNTMGPLDGSLLADVSSLRTLTAAQLRELGRVPYPLRRARGDRGFTRISWAEALQRVASRMAAAGGKRLGMYLTSRGIPNETYYVAQKVMRALGSNNVDNAARVCHSPSTLGLKQSLGVAATTCSYSDLIGTDLVVFFGSNVAVNQPVMMKYLYYARKAGTKVLVVNPYREPAMDRYWVPSDLESALFGTRMTDRFFQVQPGGDVAFVHGAIKRLLESGRVDESFVRDHTVGFDALRRRVDAEPWEDLEAASGVGREEMEAFGDLVGEAERAVLVWSMGVTQHTTGEDTVRTIVDLALCRGFLGREGCGLMPIRGHSGVQGGAEMGAYATVFPGGRPVDREHAGLMARLWGFEVPVEPGLITPQMLEAAGRGELEVLWSIGGNFLDVLPDREGVAEALERVPLRIHQDIVLSPQMLLEGEEVVVLPATTRYEVPGGVTETTTERRVVLSPEIPGPRIPEARPEWEVLAELGRLVRPELEDALGFTGTPAIREEVARVIPDYEGIQHLREKGDAFQYGGPLLCPGGVCPTPDGRARFAAVALGPRDLPEGALRLVTRRGKQFNSMIHEQVDPVNGVGRDAVLMSAADAAERGLRAGDRVVLLGEGGSLEARVVLAPVASGCVQVHWPEGNVLLHPTRRSPASGIPAYKEAYVRVEKTG